MTKYSKHVGRIRPGGHTPLRVSTPAIFDILETHRGSATVKELCNELGVSQGVFYRWMHNDDEFRALVLELREKADDQVVSALFQRAIGETVYEDKAVTVKDGDSSSVEIVAAAFEKSTSETLRVLH
jgi:transposase-like protein